MNIIKRNNVRIIGSGAKTLMLAPGFGCHQGMWKHFTDTLASEYRMILFDHVGSGGSDVSAYDSAKYDSLEGYADDVIEIVKALDAKNTIFIGHSVGTMIGALATIKAPSLFSDLIMVGPSPYYMNDGAYHGGFDRTTMQKVLADLDSNFQDWARAMAPVIMGRPDMPELGLELAQSFCNTRPDVAKRFAHVTFLSDMRPYIKDVSVRTLILQCTDDAIAPEAVGRYLHQAITNSTFVIMKAKGHCPHISEPQETIEVVRNFLSTARKSHL